MNATEGAAEDGAVPDSEVDAFFRTGSFRNDGLKAADVLPILKEKVAFVSGGRDKRGGPVLTFPARSNHDRIRQEDLRKLVTYLASVPSNFKMKDDARSYASIVIKEEPVYVDGRALDAHITWLKQEYMKAQRNWEEVDSRMRVTSGVRRKMIVDKAPLKEILALFPFLRCPYQLFREFQLLTHMDIYKKTIEILETYSENILSLHVVKNNPINIMLQENLKLHGEEDVQKYMKMTAACLLLPEVFGDDATLFAAVNEEVTVETPLLKVKNPFSMNSCAFALCVEREELSQLDDCAAALAALVAAFRVFERPCPRGIRRTLTFLASWRPR